MFYRLSGMCNGNDGWILLSTFFEGHNPNWNILNIQWILQIRRELETAPMLKCINSSLYFTTCGKFLNFFPISLKMTSKDQSSCCTKASVSISFRFFLLLVSLFEWTYCENVVKKLRCTVMNALSIRRTKIITESTQLHIYL